MKQTKAIYLTFTAEPVATAYINIPFMVKKVHIKSMNYDAGTSGTVRYVIVESNIGLNSPFGMISQDDSYSQSGFQDVEIDFKVPQPIQGFFTFTLRTMSGAVATTSAAGAGTDYIGMIVEFNSAEEDN